MNITGHAHIVEQISIQVNHVIAKKKTNKMLTITNWSKEVKRKMGKVIRKNPFVCLDDIVDTIEGFNPVIYNPNRQYVQAERVEMLYRTMKKYLDIDLTSDELDRLTLYDSQELDKFIVDLREIVNEKKRKN
jgi:hypothetical protein